MTSLSTTSRWSGQSVKARRSHQSHVPPTAHFGERARRVRVILLGDSSVGKTSLMTRFTEGTFDSAYLATIATEYAEKEVTVDDKKYVLYVVDTCGAERFKSLTQNFYRGTQICLLTFALDDYASFCNLSNWREEFLHFSGVDRALQFPFIVVGNKADLPHEQRVVKSISAQAWCENGGHGDIPYIEASAKTGQNVEELFLTAVKRLVEAERQNVNPFLDSGRKGPSVINDGGKLVDLTAEPYSQQSRCCD
ncbi:hypothetical protein BaRGS_00005012 [Batillaria attramentaria]|uniref:Uncharacterized protein n=1 Tax=Batillaria attramentaria TaxID=370345 RepID=A0ABD0LXY5_9CAEN